MTTTTVERCAGTTTPTTTWRPASKVRPTPCARPVAFVVESGLRTYTCTAHLGGIVAAAASRARSGTVNVWTIARWRAELEA